MARPARILLSLAVPILLAACATGAGDPDGPETPAEAAKQGQAPCFGDAAGDCPSGNPLEDF